MSCCSGLGVVCAVIESSSDELEAFDTSKVRKAGLTWLVQILQTSSVEVHWQWLKLASIGHKFYVTNTRNKTLLKLQIQLLGILALGWVLTDLGKIASSSHWGYISYVLGRMFSLLFSP